MRMVQFRSAPKAMAGVVLIFLGGSLAWAQKPGDFIEKKIRPDKLDIQMDLLNQRMELLPRPLPAGEEADQDPAILECIQILRPILRIELRLLTTASHPSSSQRREIAIEGARALKDAARKLSGFRNAFQRGGRNRDPFPNAEKLIRDAVLKACASRLSADQTARYQAEIDQRLQDHRQAIALRLVTNFDRTLNLSTDQREKIRVWLVTHWDDQRFPTLENLSMYDDYLPLIPDQYILSVLNPTQAKAWKSLQRANFNQPIIFKEENPMENEKIIEDEDENAAIAELEKKP